MKKTITTKNQEETMSLAAEIAQNLRGGEVLALSGELGGGKTTFTKGLAEALKVEESITSPTFVMLKYYPAKLSDGQNIELVHIDAYRTETIEDIRSVGIEDFLSAAQRGSAPEGRDDVIMVVEWAEKIREILPIRQAQGRPKNIININFKFINEKTREITIDDSNH